MKACVLRCDLALGKPFDGDVLLNAVHTGPLSARGTRRCCRRALDLHSRRCCESEVFNRTCPYAM
jgi:hypothetical protein